MGQILKGGKAELNDICSWNYNRYFQTTKGRILGLIIKECLGTLVKISNNHNIGMISIVTGVSGFQFTCHFQVIHVLVSFLCRYDQRLSAEYKSRMKSREYGV